MGSNQEENQYQDLSDVNANESGMNFIKIIHSDDEYLTPKAI